MFLDNLLYVFTPVPYNISPCAHVIAGSLELKVDQSVEDSAPLFEAEAVGTFKVITGVVVLSATVELKSVPEVPKVSADTEVTVPTDHILSADRSYDVPLIVNSLVVGTPEPAITHSLSSLKS